MRISQEQARSWFEVNRVARLATADAHAHPHLVPVTFAVHGDAIVTAVDHKPKSTRTLKRLRNIIENPHVALLVDRYEDDWTQLWWARADGEATITGAVDHPDLVDALAAKYTQYQDHRPTNTLIVVRVHRWTGWSASEF